MSRELTGSLQVKGNTYYMVINLYDGFGKRRPKWISTGLDYDEKNKRKANSILRRTLIEYEDKKVKYTKEILFTDWLKLWLENYNHNVEQITMDGYEYMINEHIIPFLANQKVKLSKLEPHHIQAYFTEKLKNGRIDGKGGLSPTSVKHHSALINSALDTAVKQNLIAYNPAERTVKPKRAKVVYSHYNIEQAKELIQASVGSTIETVVILALYYGMRRSEVLGLKWDAIDFDNNTLVVKHTVTQSKTIVKKDRTKTQSSHRTLPLIPEVKKHLKKLQVQQKKNRLLFGERYDVNDYVCKRENGETFLPDYITWKFRKLLEASGMPRIRFHDLRHSTASIFMAMGYGLKEIQEWLGHSNISTTADIYGHLEYKAKVGMANGLNDELKLSI